MDKRTMLAFGLMAALMVVWFIFNRPQLQQQTQRDAAKVTEQTEKTPAAKESSAAQITVTGQNQKEQSVQVSTDKYDIEFTNRGASVKRLFYKERNIELVVPKSPFNTNGVIDFSIYFNEDEFLKGSRLNEVNWSVVKEKDGSVKFFTTILLNEDPIQIEKRFRFSNNNYFNVEYKIQNLGSENIAFQNDAIIFSPCDILGPTLDFHNTYNLLTSIYFLNNSFDKGGKAGGLFSNNDPIGREMGETSWFGIMSRYFLIIMIPDEFTGNGVIFDRRQDSGYRIGMYLRTNMLTAGTAITRSFRVYVGEKNKERLAAVGRLLVDAADISKWIEPIRYFVLWCLMKINSVIGNFGWSLVIFSLLTKIVFTPLTLKSMNSMKRMQKLTPMMNEMRAKYKDKPEVFQREYMKLLKEHKVNPFGGCLPLLLQMPFFFALYSALINSIDLWNASFGLWIKDLSMPDTVATIAGFNINILPIIMTATSFAQQKMSTVDTGPQQKMMMMMMPVILLFVFWNMPSGLVLYWTLQNVFQISHQLIINKFGKKEEN